MDWQKRNIEEGSLEETYTQKYGLSSDYQKAQKILYAEPEIRKSLDTALSWLTLGPNPKILDIGVNNGYELELIDDHFSGTFLDTADIVAFDLIDDVLVNACKQLSCVDRPNLRLVRGDIRTFQGVDIFNNESVNIADGSIDLIIAITSLQSSSLMHDLEGFMTELLKKMSGKGQMLVATPNSYVDSKGQIVMGLFDATKQRTDLSFAGNFADRLQKIMGAKGFACERAGALSIFQFFHR